MYTRNFAFASFLPLPSIRLNNDKVAAARRASPLQGTRTVRFRAIACALLLVKPTGVVFQREYTRVIAQTRSMHRMRNVGTWISGVANLRR